MTNCNCECHDGAHYSGRTGACQACWDTHQVADLQRRLREAEERGAGYAKDALQFHRERDAARAAVHLLAGALERIEEWNPGGGVYCQGCYSETQRIAERALADPVVVAAMEVKPDA